jgi:putative redox protein
MADVQTTYDSTQHCTAVTAAKGKQVSMDCPYTGKGEELSPTNLVEAALGGCMLLAMGAIAMRHDIDLSGARMDVTIAAIDKPVMRFSDVEVQAHLPENLSERERAILERAAEGCPIKHSFGADIPVRVRYLYDLLPNSTAASPEPVQV